MKKVSCGILLINNKKQLFLEEITPSPSNGWSRNKMDIPKGGKEESDKSFLEAALRELKEESNLQLLDEDIKEIIDLGLFKYNKQKDLYLFLFYDKNNKYLNDKYIFENCFCASTYIDKKNGKEYREVKDFFLFNLNEVFKQSEKILNGEDKDKIFLNKSLAILLKSIENKIYQCLV